jgi:hypothetical protein
MLAEVGTMSKEELEKFLESVKQTGFFSMNEEALPEWKLVYGVNAREAEDSLKEQGIRTMDVRYDRVREQAKEIAAKKDSFAKDFSDAWREAFRVVGEKALEAEVSQEWCKHYLTLSACGDAGLVANCLSVKEKLPAGSLEYALRRWDVWKRGYALLGDYDGSFYVYAGKKEK